MTEHLRLSKSARLTQADKNETRKTLKKLFPSRECFALVRPVSDEAKLRNVERLEYKEVRQEFKDQVEDLAAYVRAHAVPKSVGSVMLRGDSFCEYLQIIADASNSAKFPQIA